MNTVVATRQPKRSPKRENIVPFPRQVRRQNMRDVARLLLLLAAVVVIMVAVYGILFGDRKVTALVFEGHQILSEVHLRDLAAITEDDSLRKLDLREVERRVLADPYVKTCEARSTSNGVVYITITERVPVASVSCNNRVYEIDEEGVVLREVPPLGRFTPPLITSIPGLSPLQPGDRFEHEHFAAALRLWRAMASSPVLSRMTLSEIAAFSPGSLITYFDELPCEVRWSGVQCDEQVQRFETLCAWHHGLPPCGEYIDMRFGSQVAVK
ncbi:MAG TPA: FtsQ-type POTRA domain-containing protein [Candidatus Hydrogenedentes bacterium]|nr:FtsQ-type POTRA domain-containing protein [Candidatus Hydrogenedentota bacterium]HOK88613.1 FtsQ-type POTRA domain-containing protein [Candidatus Hydrogenedentota bacterium]HOV60904.1 FtsQ-type POTRA domain-containing protein [Candidatus Hydrogenedentota bacterium]